MTFSGILSSPSQRRSFLLATCTVLLISILATIAISQFAPSKPIWNALNSLFNSVIASGIFAIVAGLYTSYFFVDPSDIQAESTLLPQDIDQALQAIATEAVNYKIFVRTGRHFRAEVMPLLITQARKSRHPIQVEVVLLDFRDHNVCERYANYRKTSSFDRRLWDKRYVQKEVLGTILMLSKASRSNPGLVDVQLFLSKRLSTFRIEGSSEQILVTREDPKDLASRYSRTHRDFSAYVTEFGWIRDEAYAVAKDTSGLLPATLNEMFGENPDITTLETLAIEATHSGSPYVR